MRTLTPKDRNVTIAEMDELEITPQSRWLAAASGNIIVVLSRHLGADWMPIRIEVLDLVNESVSIVHPADFARWVQEKRFTRFTRGSWTIPMLHEPVMNIES